MKQPSLPKDTKWTRELLVFAALSSPVIDLIYVRVRDGRSPSLNLIPYKCFKLSRMFADGSWQVPRHVNPKS